MGRIFYVSSMHGDDTNSGQTPEDAFRSLRKINQLEIQPGDQIFLERGSVFIGEYLHLYAGGIKEAPVVVDAYGEGALPRIEADGNGIWYQNYGGHLDNVVRLAIQAGVKPMTAIQMATINSAEAYRIDHMVGSICPGRIADILFVDDLEAFGIKEVMTNGKMVAKDHKLTYDLKAPERSSAIWSFLVTSAANASISCQRSTLLCSTAKSKAALA